MLKANADLFGSWIGDEGGSERLVGGWSLFSRLKSGNVLEGLIKQPSQGPSDETRGPLRILIVGPSNRFQSGISTYTIRLANALHEAGHQVSVIAFRKLLPRFLFPGRERVGDALSSLKFHPGISIYDGMDYNNPLTWRRAARFLKEQKPDEVVLQWWTASAAHMHHLVRWAARRAGARVLVEMHEALDPLEQANVLIRTYSQVVGNRLIRGNDGYVTHSESDRRIVADEYGIDPEKISVIPHGSYDHYGGHQDPREARKELGILEDQVILFFGLIRPYKGVRVLVDAFESLPPDTKQKTRLLVVGEVWEEGKAVVERIESSPDKAQITLINRYVPDDEVGRYFSAASIVALPYRRASQSGVAHIAINYGKPLVVSRVGGLVESMQGLPTVRFVEPENVPDLVSGIIDALGAEESAIKETSTGVAWHEVAHMFVTQFNQNRISGPQETQVDS